MAHTPSKYQQAFYDCFNTTNFNIGLDAKAGSGKTSTIVGLISMISPNDNALFVAFNKHIAKTLKERITRPNTTISTIHGMGSKLLFKNYKSNLDEHKYRNIAKTLIKKWDFNGEPIEYITTIMKLCDLMRLSMCETILEGETIASHHGIECLGGEITHAIELIQAGRKIVNTIDFTDMLYLPNYYNLSPFKQKVVIVDEAQDLSKAARLLVLRHVAGNGRLIFVGDRSQAIYSFAGGDIVSFNDLCSLPNTKLLPLSICYRCSKAVIREAQKIVPDIEWADDAIEGEVNHNGKVADIKDSDAVLCRTTYPLVKLCMEYLSKGIKASIKGRDIGANLIKFIEKSKLVNVIDLYQYFADERKKLISKICRKLGMSAAEATEQQEAIVFNEKVQIVELLSEGLKTCEEITTKINNIFSDDTKDGILMSTVHKAKGLEFDNVFCIQPELLPAPWAKLPHDRVQEMNLKYVCITRARKNFTYVTDYDAYEKESKKKIAETVDKIQNSYE